MSQITRDLIIIIKDNKKKKFNWEKKNEKNEKS